MTFKFNDELSQSTPPGRNILFHCGNLPPEKNTYVSGKPYFSPAIRQTQEKYPFRIDALVLLKEDALKSSSYQAFVACEAKRYGQNSKAI
ncbi:MAG: hypothetical protein C4522_13345 [Desulfobacteraceae bacterium]|nr:MAG: hypothetical protein C4522_13345 [Desulfobacteraceae bacterium]